MGKICSLEKNNGEKELEVWRKDSLEFDHVVEEQRRTRGPKMEL